MTVTLNASIRLSTGLASRTFEVPSNQVLMLAMERVDLISSGTWVLTAATVTSA